MRSTNFANNDAGIAQLGVGGEVASADANNGDADSTALRMIFLIENQVTAFNLDFSSVIGGWCELSRGVGH